MSSWPAAALICRDPRLTSANELPDKSATSRSLGVVAAAMELTGRRRAWLRTRSSHHSSSPPMPKLYEALAEAFLAEGVDTQFILMGDGNMHWCTAFAKLP